MRDVFAIIATVIGAVVVNLLLLALAAAVIVGVVLVALNIAGVNL